MSGPEVNLLLYSENSTKIPSKFLIPPKNKKEINALRILLSHYFDLSFVFILTTAFNSFLIFSLNSFLPIQRLENALLYENTNFISIIFPFVLLTYYFFCYFMNHGQSVGQTIMKQRVEMDDKNYHSALKASLFSSIICLSAGLMFFLAKKKFIISSHDYLYQNLVATKEEPSPLLVEMMNESKDLTHNEEFKIAA